MSAASQRWDAQTEYDVGVLIRQYLARHPPPAGVRFEQHFAAWASELVAAGEARLGELGEHHLRIAG